MTPEKLQRALHHAGQRIQFRQRIGLLLLVMALGVLLLYLAGSLEGGFATRLLIALLILSIAAIGSLGDVLESRHFASVRAEALERLTHVEQLERENKELYIANQWLFEELNRTNWDGLRNMGHDVGRISGAVREWALKQVMARGQYERLSHQYEQRRE